MTRKMSRNICFLIPFAAVWLALITANLLKPESDFSENENRYLSDVPEFSSEALLNGEYMSALDTYVNDQFILRDEWINVQSISEHFLGKREINNVFIGNGALFSKIQPSGQCAEKNLEGINSFSAYSGLDCFLVLIPSSTEINSEQLPPFSVKTDEKEIINNAYRSLEKASPVSVYEALSANSDQYIYYRTDHHWTTYGAYLAYKEICGALNIKVDDYTAEKISDCFNGTLYSSSGVRFVESDTIESFVSAYENGMTVFDGSDVTEYDSVYFTEYLEKKDKYSYFLGKNQPLVTLHSTCNSGKKLLMFKDSFSHCLAPMLLSAYEEITLVDMRYINTKLDNLIDTASYDDALFIYSTDVFTTQLGAAKLKED